MLAFLLGVVALLLLLFAGSAFVKADPKQVARVLRWVGGGWREYAQGGAGAGTRPADGGKMTEREAYQILGLQPGASPEEINRAHRSLIKAGIAKVVDHILCLVYALREIRSAALVGV
jgi:hypothetical protein